MVSNSVRLVFHSMALAHHIFTVVFGINEIDVSKAEDIRVIEMKEFGPRYITSWNLALQLVYLTLALIYDILSLVTEPKTTKMLRTIETIKGHLFTVILFPTTLFVSSMFWALFHINRDFVMPEAFEEVTPWWLNHSIHTVIMVVLIGEVLFSGAPFPRPKFITAVLALEFFAFIYFIQFMATYIQYKRWLYGVFYGLNTPQLVAFLVMQQIVAILYLKLSYEVQEYKAKKLKTN